MNLFFAAKIIKNLTAMSMICHIFAEIYQNENRI